MTLDFKKVTNFNIITKLKFEKHNSFLAIVKSIE